MPQVRLSQRVFQEARRFFEQHPVYRIEQVAEAEMESPLVRVVSVRCKECGEALPAPKDVMPSGALAAVRFTHEWSLDRSKRCGGAVSIRTVPVLGLTAV